MPHMHSNMSSSCLWMKHDRPTTINDRSNRVCSTTTAWLNHCDLKCQLILEGQNYKKMGGRYLKIHFEHNLNKRFLILWNNGRKGLINVNLRGKWKRRRARKSFFYYLWFPWQFLVALAEKLLNVAMVSAISPSCDWVIILERDRAETRTWIRWKESEARKGQMKGTLSHQGFFSMRHTL